METENRPEQKDSRPLYVVIQKEDLERICERAAQVGAKTAIDKVDSERNAEKLRVMDKRLHNTDMLLRNYQMFKLNLKESISSISEAQDDYDVQEILSLMDSRTSGDITVESIAKSKAKTAVIIDHIDTMLEIYKAFCDKSDDDLDYRRYSILMDRYINDPSLTITEIAKKYNVSKESVYGDLKIAKERMAALIFGIDGMNIRRR